MDIWNMLNINKDLYKIFDDGPVTALRRNKHLNKLIGSTSIEKRKVKKLNNTDINGKSS